MTAHPHAGWDLPLPHVVELRATAADIDAYQHVNNAVYVTWLDRGMAVLRSVIAYQRPARRIRSRLTDAARTGAADRVIHEVFSACAWIAATRRGC